TGSAPTTATDHRPRASTTGRRAKQPEPPPVAVFSRSHRLPPPRVPPGSARPVIEELGVHQFRYVRLFADASGESHFQDIAVAPDGELSVPPAPPLRMRTLGPAITVALVGGDSGWHGEVAHPAPFRMLQSCLSGT